MDESLSPEDALLPPVPSFQLEAWLPAGNSILVRRENSPGQQAQARLEAWSRDFVLARLAADGVRDASSLQHPQGFPLISRTLDGARLYVQATKPEATNG